MSKRRKKTSSGTMLDLWRPPQGAGEPVGCLATTFTFMPALFDEQCLARFLEIESEPDREDLAFLLERESRLGGVYAGVLVDFTQAGVEHSLRWDVLPVRIHAGKQHAKLSLLVWTHHVRIIVASANLTEPGYRSNHEVAASVDLTPKDADQNLLADAISFLRSLIALVPGASDRPPDIQRAESFLDHAEQQVAGWKRAKVRRHVRQTLVYTLPRVGDQASQSSLDQAIMACRKRGGSPKEAWIASPFFDVECEDSRVTAALCKSMARGTTRTLRFCVPAITDDSSEAVPRLAAPKALILTPPAYRGEVWVEILPELDREKNRRPWHAKMLALQSSHYTALMIGSSNFTCAGMGVAHHRNAEANLLFTVDRISHGREVGQIESVWPEMETIADPDAAEWLGTQPDREEEEQSNSPPLPAGFLSACYRAGDIRSIYVKLAPDALPDNWEIHACGQEDRELLTSDRWDEDGRLSLVEFTWAPVQPPQKLLVRWADNEAFLPLNVEDGRQLPPPATLDQMSADDMLLILAAADPSAAFRAWAKRQQPSDLFDDSLDSATPIDLDPLRRYDLQTTFLRRIRRRARILAQMRSNLEREVWGTQALEWRLRGLVGIAPLADRLVQELADTNGAADEALLMIADFVIVLREVNYRESDGSLSQADFEQVFRPFLQELAASLRLQIEVHRDRISDDLLRFWDRVLEQCQ